VILLTVVFDIDITDWKSLFTHYSQG